MVGPVKLQACTRGSGSDENMAGASESLYGKGSGSRAPPFLQFLSTAHLA